MGVLLAGGESRRFGEDKRSAVWGGATLTERAAATLASVVDRVVLSVGVSDVDAVPERERVVDERPALGPLGGLLTSLKFCRDRGVSGALCLAVDLPLITPIHLRRILDNVEPGAEIVAAAGPGRPRRQPLCGWYSTRLVEPLELYLEEGHRRVISFAESRATTWVEFTDASALANVNTLDDLLALEKDS